MDGKLRNMASVYVTQGDHVLLLYRKNGRVVNNVWAPSAGGHFEVNELNDARACALRELEEETRLTEADLEDLRLRYVTLRLTDGEIRQNYYFFAKLREGVNPGLDSREGDLKWFAFSELNALDMPYTAKYVMAHYLANGMRNGKIYGGIADRKRVAFAEMPEF